VQHIVVLRVAERSVHSKLSVSEIAFEPTPLPVGPIREWMFIDQNHTTRSPVFHVQTVLVGPTIIPRRSRISPR
jgi:hypothetical protein